MLPKYRIVRDVKHFLLQKDMSLFNGWFGREWRSIGAFSTLEEAKQEAEKFSKEPEVLWESD